MEKVCDSCIGSFYHDLSEEKFDHFDIVHYDNYSFIQFYYSYCKSLVMLNKKQGDWGVIQLYYQLIKKYFMISKEDIVIVVPDSLVKRFFKGKSAFSYLATYFKKDGYTVCDNILMKKLFTGKQKLRSKQDRIEKVKNDFYINNKIIVKNDKNVVLIDDIYTTGSTINRCSELLKEYGFKTVKAITIFKVIFRNAS
ncbi:MAG: hypothetical protein A2015_08735 [Spirochaetes bacterium GWF1_31_7]|nr:MAG: hypothetical protein A2Y30_06925 [Spirochaetes bacterium GWE1_32_154]OHD48007.1 MAG: hypothetical protein A2015_08735 [Spirochaetes bacterium GWF1_31_7]OHD49676.1 MAG: hypothetical protein A2Y29_06900 [Spirochaetes bacterium GWE2_31_10]